jgi:chromosome segregation ATPase
MAGVTQHLLLKLFFLQAQARKHKQMQRALQASEDACRVHAAHAATLQQHVRQLEAQLLHLQDMRDTDRQQQAQVQQQLRALQSQLCGSEQKVAQLQEVVDALQAQVGHQCRDQLRAETGQGCSVRGRMSNA